MKLQAQAINFHNGGRVLCSRPDQHMLLSILDVAETRCSMNSTRHAWKPCEDNQCMHV